jgi:predicted Zn-ribbon and HTH transcriptional regulator
MKLTKKQIADYIASGNKCPFCLNEQIEGASVETGKGEASQGMDCLNCGATWTDFYTLNRIIVMDEPDGPKTCGDCGMDFMATEEVTSIEDHGKCIACHKQWQFSITPDDDRFPIEEWRVEAGNGDTVLGYDEWRAHKIESDADDKRSGHD